jgi:hypothetical protein
MARPSARRRTASFIGALIAALPPGWAYLTDDEGNYLTDDAGAFIIVENT